MEVVSLNNGVYLLISPEGERLFCFVSDTCFRYFTPDTGHSYCVTSFPPVSEGVVVEEGEAGVIFSYEGNEVVIQDDLSVSASYLGNSYLKLEPRGHLEAEQGSELAAKEGHGSHLSTSAKGGIRIEVNVPVYGLGERTGPLDKRGYDYVNWNTDDPSAHVDTFKSLYQSMPFCMAHRGENSLGVFLDNTSKTHFDVNKTDPDAILIDYEAGEPDFYFFVGTIQKIIADFTLLTGRSQLPPYWALGAQQSRWSYADAREVESVIDGYREKDIPLSTVYLDIDYMSAYKDFTVDPNKYPDVKQWLERLAKKSIHIVPIIDAGVKAEEGYDIYDEGIEKGYFCTLNGEVYHNEVWPGDSVFPAFLDPKVRMWWATKIKRMLDLGFSGIWNDMNEPASFKGPLPMDVIMGEGVPHSLAHNVYAHHMCMAGAQGFALAAKRPFQLTRAGYAGTCLYASSWAGDNQSIYDHLRMSLPELMNMSMSGQSYVGVDIGGFGGDSTPELLTKWAIASIFNPLYRNHSALGTLNQEPYLLKGDYLRGYRNAVMARYEILPTLYDELFLSESNGSIALRPLVYNFPEDERTHNENTEVMLGDSLLLAPALFPGQSKRSCYFPATFLRVEDGTRYEKGDNVIDVDLLDMPLFIREDGLAVFAPKGNREAAPSSTLRLVWGGKKARCYHFEDEGDGLGYKKGEYNLYELEVSEEEGVRITPLHEGFKSRYKKLVVDVPGGLHMEEDLS